MKHFFSMMVILFGVNTSVLANSTVALDVGQSVRVGRTLVTCGFSANPGGCNSYGCWSGGGGCNSYGCWSNYGGCNSYGCWNGPNGSCNSYGCTDNGRCNSYGCPK